MSESTPKPAVKKTAAKKASPAKKAVAKAPAKKATPAKKTVAKKAVAKAPAKRSVPAKKSTAKAAPTVETEKKESVPSLWATDEELDSGAKRKESATKKASTNSGILEKEQPLLIAAGIIGFIVIAVGVAIGLRHRVK